MKLAIGTAQFGLNYGISNSTGLTPLNEVGKIFDFAFSNGLDTLDTASAYGISEQVLGDTGVASWKVITKVPSIKNNNVEVRRWVFDHVLSSLAKLRVNQLEGVMLHDATDLLGVEGPRIKAALEEIKAEGLAKKIGYSIYSPVSLYSLLEVMSPDIIQAPLNLLDQRLITTGWLRNLALMEIEVHTRSVFLQGLLLMLPENRPAKFNKWKGMLDKVDRLVRLNGDSRLKVCLGFVRQHPDVSNVVIGVESLQHLKEVLLAWNSELSVDCTNLACDDPLLIEPINW